ncbi:uncharacterized protein LOC116199617 isoform X2 [Punica granatum]|uniref:Uncharacterized protein LOC116199617 isoform X2 n=1 Tax=Punica granatum TaxID=22663 RepID=A0A6P8CQC3_PUNGR|nr:uncharacterized protein LOC116199617 isoform X2 [Punica granatum]
MEIEPKRRKLESPSNRGVPLISQANKEAAGKASDGSSVWQPPSGEAHMRIQQAKNFAVIQAQQDGSKGNYRIFDSPFGSLHIIELMNNHSLDGTRIMKRLHRYCHTYCNGTVLSWMMDPTKRKDRLIQERGQLVDLPCTAELRSS